MLSSAAAKGTDLRLLASGAAPTDAAIITLTRHSDNENAARAGFDERTEKAYLAEHVASSGPVEVSHEAERIVEITAYTKLRKVENRPEQQISQRKELRKDNQLLSGVARELSLGTSAGSSLFEQRMHAVDNFRNINNDAIPRIHLELTSLQSHKTLPQTLALETVHYLGRVVVHGIESLMVFCKK